MKLWSHHGISSLRKHPFLLALRRWGRFARRNDVPPRATSPAEKSVEKRMFSQAMGSRPQSQKLELSYKIPSVILDTRQKY